MKKKPPFNQEMMIRGANRRLFARSPVVQEKLAESRQEFPRYKKDGSRAKKNWVKRQCEICLQWVSSSHIAVDHIDPVVPPDGFPASFDMWDRITVFLKRLWCDKSNLQRLCSTCHSEKTQAERINRLVKQYSLELDDLELRKDLSIKEFKKILSKYISKKKTAGLESIAERALRLKSNL